ncbi:MAG: hypothetical protein K6E67_01530 [Prevotella sp.]|nr:hypothetical protein [Prevotella sp.]
MMRKLIYIGCCVAMMGCSGPSVPEVFTDSKELPKIYPDYTDVTIPVNMAPLTFELDEAADEMIARFAVGDEQIVCKDKAQPDADDWRMLAEKAKGGAIAVDVYARKADQWTHYKPFSIFVSPDSIDSYLSYRLIFPSFVSYEALTISQRCLENYDESVIYDNILCTFEKDGQCINCHHYQQYNPRRMQFHARQNNGGTVIAYDGKIKKVDMRNDSILSAGVYPAWHPWLNLIVYSTNKTLQSFHTTDPNKIEVYDTESDIIAYDVVKGEVTNLENDPQELEVFPAWAPDGKTLYYCSAHFERQDTTVSLVSEMVARSKELKYKIYKKNFDPETMQFGPRELVFSADSTTTPHSTFNTPHSMSATLPRVSPDGRYLMFTLAESGVFHIWHHDADLWVMDLENGEVRNIEEINSPDTESYHSWSSNGRWVVFSSRRDDGTYTRPFFAHIDKDGHWAKPFELPQADPDYHRQFMKCYNIPEFMKGPVTIKPQDFADVLKGKGKPVRYVPALSK